MDHTSTTRLIFETVPQIFESEDGPYRIHLPVDGEDFKIHSIVPLSRELEEYLKTCVELWEELKPLTEGKVTQVLERQWIQQKFAVAWLEKQTGFTNWQLILDYARRLSQRTHENQAMPKTVLIEMANAPEDSQRLSDEDYFKVFDWLGASNLTFFKVDQKLRIKSLEAIERTDVANLEGYRFYPDFLHPVLDMIKNTDSVVVHVNNKGDLLIANQYGIIASNRKNRWTIFDVDHLIQSVAQILDEKIGPELKPNDPTCVACSMFQILFDISFKRHGGLIVIDHAEKFAHYVVKGIERGERSPLNSIFTHRAFDGLEFSAAEVRKLVELSSVDGAIALDTRGNLVQIGSMIVSHPLAQNSFGARDTAAYSAAKYGATSFKVSADGEVSILFKMSSFTGDEVHRLDLI
jgi:hypothetical protein